MITIYLVAILAALVALIVALLMSIARDLKELNGLVREHLREMGANINDDSSRVLKMDFGHKKPARIVDRSKKWIQERETASRG